MNDSTQFAQSALPPWFVRPQPVDCGQSTLFPRSLPAALASLSVSPDELGLWHGKGWVSFDQHRSNPLEEWDVHEIQFVRDVVRSGLTDAKIAVLFEQLPRPMNFHADAVAYSFSLGWVAPRIEPAADPLDVVEEHLDTWIETLLEEGKRSRLEELRDRLVESLASGSATEDQCQA